MRLTESDSGDVTDGFNAVGVLQRDSYPNPRWLTCMKPSRMRDWAELVAYCWSHDPVTALEVGLVESSDDHTAPMLVAGEADAPRMVAIAPRQDTRFVPGVML